MGETLTASADGIADADGLTGAVFSWQWLAVDASSETAIEGATEASYTLTEADAGKAVKVRVTFTDGLGTEESVTSEATESVAALVPGAPRELAVASLEDGEPVLALVWTASESDGGSAITGYKVQWKSSSEEYDGTESSTRQAVVTELDNLTYRIAGLTAGVEYTVRVMASNAVGDGAPAEATATMADTLAPTLETAAVNESTLTLTWSQALDGKSVPAADAFTVEVEGTARDVDAVSVAESAVTLTLASAVAPGEAVTVGYAVPEDDSAARIQDAAGSDAAGFSEVAATNETEGSVNTAQTGLPVISGTPRVGETLTASADEIADADGLEHATFAYQWLSNNGTSDADIDDATKSTYTVAAADVGKALKVRVTFTDDGGTEETLVSEATDAVAAPPSGLSVADAEATEEEDAALDFVVTLDPAATAAATVDYATADGTATAGSDYTATSGTLTFQPGETSKTVSVPITDDAVDDGGETLTLTLSSASGADLDDAEATGTIQNTETPLTASFEDVPSEHDGSTVFTFRLRFSEDPAVSYEVLRDRAFSVSSGGTVKKARRVDGRNDLREIHVQPETTGERRADGGLRHGGRQRARGRRLPGGERHADVPGGRAVDDDRGRGARRRARRGRGDADAAAVEPFGGTAGRRRGHRDDREPRSDAAGALGAVRPDGGGARGRARGRAAPGAARAGVPGPVRGPGAAARHGARHRAQFPAPARQGGRHRFDRRGRPRFAVRRAGGGGGAARDAGACRRRRASGRGVGSDGRSYADGRRARCDRHGRQPDGRRIPPGRWVQRRRIPADGPRRR